MVDKFLKVSKSPRLRPYFRWLGATLFFLIVTWIHMGPSLTHINTVVLNIPGDHTSGIIYTSWVHPNTPVPGNTTLTNYPTGESLRLPIVLSSQVLSVGHWLLSHFGNAVTGWNLLVFIGYMGNALLMFGFIRWLTKNTWASLFSGYALAFTPYHVFASRGQIAGFYGGMFVLGIWQFLSMWQKPHWLKAVSLGTILGISFYTDGYFILIGLVLLMALWVSALGYGLWIKSAKAIKGQLLSLLLVSVVAGIFLFPLVLINFIYASKINSLFDNARGSIEANAQTYSAQLSMYFNPKSLIYLGFSVLVLAAVSVYLLCKYVRRNPHKQLEATNFRLFVIWTALVITLLAIWISLRPVVHILGIPVYNPSRVIIFLTSAWRVFGRLYSLVSIGVIILAGLGLASLIRKFPARRWLIIFVSFLILISELGFYSHVNKAPTFNYNDIPQVYRWLKDNPQVRAVAEYPLDEPPQGTYLADYFTFQQISSKPMINTYLPNSPQMPLRRSIVGISDPQTLPVLRALGVDVLNVRNVNNNGTELNIRKTASKNPELDKIFTDNRPGFTVDSYKIKTGKTADWALVMPNARYENILLDTNGSAFYTFTDNPTLSVIKLPNSKSRKSSVTANITLSAGGTSINPAEERQSTILQNGKVLWSGMLSRKPIDLSLKVSTEHPITIYNQNSTTLQNTILSQLYISE